MKRDPIFTQNLKCLGQFEIPSFPKEIVKKRGFAFSLIRERVYYTDIPDEIKKDWGEFIAEGATQMAFDHGDTVIKIVNSVGETTPRGSESFYKGILFKNEHVYHFIPVTFLGYLKVKVHDRDEPIYLLVQEQEKVVCNKPPLHAILKFAQTICKDIRIVNDSVICEMEDYYLTDLRNENVIERDGEYYIIDCNVRLKKKLKGEPN